MGGCRELDSGHEMDGQRTTVGFWIPVAKLVPTAHVASLHCQRRKLSLDTSSKCRIMAISIPVKFLRSLAQILCSLSLDFNEVNLMQCAQFSTIILKFIVVMHALKQL